MLKAEITLRASSFTESHKSSNCKTRHKGTGQVLYSSRRLDVGPQALTGWRESRDQEAGAVGQEYPCELSPSETRSVTPSRARAHVFLKGCR